MPRKKLARFLSVSKPRTGKKRADSKKCTEGVDSRRLVVHSVFMTNSKKKYDEFSDINETGVLEIHKPGCQHMKRHRANWHKADFCNEVEYRGDTIIEVEFNAFLEMNWDFIHEWEGWNDDETTEENARRYYAAGEGYAVRVFPCAHGVVKGK